MKIVYLLSSLLSIVKRRSFGAYHIQNLKSEVQNAPNSDYLISRVQYYCKITEKFKIKEPSENFRSLLKLKHPSMPTLDLLESIANFGSSFRLNCYLEDFADNVKFPTIVKCREINNENKDYVLMPINYRRFFLFEKDSVQFVKKSPTAIFRGPCYREHRVNFVKNNYQSKKADIADTKRASKGKPFYSPFTKVSEQLLHKFIISVEGNDVASNLPWILSSNSLAFMTKPKFEGWFTQGKLKPNHHYVLLKDDYSDLEEKIDYYSSNTDEALYIINNAHKHVAQFFDHKSELLISLLVLEKYFTLSGQLN